MRRTQTFGNFYPFDRFIIYGTSARFDELVAFDAQIQYACAFYGQLDQLFRRGMDDVGCSLGSRY
jgi:hypothetical protein